MLFTEPSRTPYDLSFSLLGIPVRVHPMFWLVSLLMGLGGTKGDPLPIVIWMGAVFVSIVVHEMGHAVAARAYGWWPSITLYAFGGLASYRPTYRTPRSQILISLAGPAAGFLFAGVIVGSIAASGHRLITAWAYGFPVLFEPFPSHQLNLLLLDLLFINIFWGLANLMPIYPLDGGQVAREIFGVFNRDDGLRQSLWLSIVMAAVLAVVALARWHDQFLALFLGYLAYTNYQTLQAYFGPTGGLGGFR